MATTIKDVAREAGVSVASVSRALNGRGTVVEAKRRHIAEVARRLRYVPHSAARSLITRQTNTIGILLPDLHGEFFSELIRGIDAAARDHGLHILVSSSHGDAAEAAIALNAMRGRVDGLLVMSPHVDAGFLDEHLAGTVPMVLMNTDLVDPRLPVFAVDNVGGARAITAHLLACGHRRIAIVTGPEGNHDARERLRGYRETLAEADGAGEPWVIPGDFSEESGYRAGQALGQAAVRPDAVFASNDMMAIGCLFGLRQAGLDVPGDLALAGFDDIPIARFVSPPLTSARVRVERLGALALERLVQLVAATPGTAPGGYTLLPVELVVRASCGAPAGATVSPHLPRPRSGRSAP
jgi:LacI family transcriptional regulator